MIEYSLLPKLLGLAERAWAQPAAWESEDDHEARQEAIDQDWSVFANTIGRRELKRLDQLSGGFNYRIPLPGAELEDGTLRANILFPGLEIRYTTDGSEPDKNAALYTGPVQTDASEVQLRAFDTRGRASRTTILRQELKK